MRRWLTLVAVVAFSCAPVGIAPADGPLRLVIFGDSVAYGTGDESGRGIAGNLDAELERTGIPHQATRNDAVNGARTWDVARSLCSGPAREIIQSATGVILSIGGNDLYGDSRARLFTTIAPQLAMRLTLHRIRGIVASIHRLNSTASVFLIGLYDPYRVPFLDRAVNEWDALLLRTFAADRHVTVIRVADLFSNRDRRSPLDHFHPNSDAYHRIARRIADAL